MHAASKPLVRVVLCLVLCGALAAIGSACEAGSAGSNAEGDGSAGTGGEGGGGRDGAVTGDGDGDGDSGNGGRDGGAGSSGSGGTSGGDGGNGGSGGAGGNGTGGNGGSGGDDSGVSSGRVKAFIAQGHVGRTVVSCDDGRTWIGDRSIDLEGPPELCDMVAPVICFTDGEGCRFMRNGVCEEPQTQCDCDHHPGASTGMAYGDGVWIAAFGWGAPGTVRRSTDGFTWDVVIDQTNAAGVAFGDGAFVLGGSTPRASSDDGESFSERPMVTLHGPNDEPIFNVRALTFTDEGSGRFMMVAQDGPNVDVLLSDDQGQSFVRPTTLPEGCGASLVGIASGGGSIVMVGYGGQACASHDGGDTFESAMITFTTEIGGSVVWDGEKFLVWETGRVHTSTDGAAWQSTALEPNNVLPGAVAYAPDTGTFVAVRGGWDRWYDEQLFFRSSDGVTWETLDAAHATGGHPIGNITYGEVEPSAQCPLSE